MTKTQPTIASPCIRNCCLDSEDFCMGCGRHIEEILSWQRASDAERQLILERAAERRLKLQSAINKR